MVNFEDLGKLLRGGAHVADWGLGIIGCGSIADFHLEAIRENTRARLVGVSSRSEHRARAIGEREGCLWTTDYHELLQNPEIDLVCVTTSSGTHGKIGLDVLHAGKHLLVEKPIALTSIEAERMIRLAEAKGLTLSVVSQRRFEQQHQAVKRVIEQGGIGKLLLVEVACAYYRSQAYYDTSDWRGTLAEDGGALMNQGIHSIDLMLWMVAQPVRTVYGKVATNTHRMEAEDMGLALLTFEKGTFGKIMSSTSILPGFSPSLNFYGEKGTIKIEAQQITHWTVPGITQPDIGEESSSGGGVSDPRNISTLYHNLQISELLDALEAGRQPAVTGEDGQKTVRLIEAIYESSVNGIEVNLGA
jgi:UDP-N-acetyl-2-amino-2-deoxyglucuronate dehydrogenase